MGNTQSAKVHRSMTELTKPRQGKKKGTSRTASPRRIVVDVDGTICLTKPDGASYLDAKPSPEIIQRLRDYRKEGFTIVLYTSRQMRTHEGNLGKIVADTVPVLIEWLGKHKVPYDEIHIGKPWCGYGGFYVDDKSVRPNEFATMSYEQIVKMLRIGGEEE